LFCGNSGSLTCGGLVNPYADDAALIARQTEQRASKHLPANLLRAQNSNFNFFPLKLAKKKKNRRETIHY